MLRGTVTGWSRDSHPVLELTPLSQDGPGTVSLSWNTTEGTVSGWSQDTPRKGLLQDGPETASMYVVLLRVHMLLLCMIQLQDYPETVVYIQSP